jgi:hypothetical protein
MGAAHRKLAMGSAYNGAMNTVFHCLIGAGIGHVAASRLKEPASNALRRSDFPIIAGAATVSFLSHGVLDGLKHGYPFSPLLDITLGASIVIAWCLAVRRRFIWLFAAVFFASVLPDLIDLAPVLLKSKLGIDLHLQAGERLFPWHWPDGSGSMYPSSSAAPDRFRILDLGQNRAISVVNHAIILAVAAACVWLNPSVFRPMLYFRAPDKT